jgi:Membrane domain of glycerophosphoryl diester phosphodiesterase
VARSVDMMTVWNQTTQMLAQHREAIVAIAGILIFIPNWAAAHFVPPPDIAGLTSLGAIFEEIGQNFINNWTVKLPLNLISFFGGLAVLAVLLRPDREHVGDALKFAGGSFLIYLAVSLLTGALISFGALAFFIGLFYVAGRLMIVAPAIVSAPESGISAIKTAWEMTRGVGWKCAVLLLIVLLIVQIIMAVVGLTVGIICALIAGPQGIPIVQHFFSALTGSALGVTMLALEAALYRHLQAQR